MLERAVLDAENLKVVLGLFPNRPGNSGAHTFHFLASDCSFGQQIQMSNTFKPRGEGLGDFPWIRVIPDLKVKVVQSDSTEGPVRRSRSKWQSVHGPLVSCRSRRSIWFGSIAQDLHSAMVLAAPRRVGNVALNA